MTYIFFFTFYFLQLYWPNGISPKGRGKPAVTESRYPTYSARWVFPCSYNPPNSDMDYRIFNARTDVDACDCTRGCTYTVWESALKVDSGRKIPCRTGESNLRQRRACSTLYQLSCMFIWISPKPCASCTHRAHYPSTLLCRSCLY